MADKYIGIGGGGLKRLREMPDGTYAEVVSTGAGGGGGVVTDSTGQYTFDLASLASVPTYDANGNQKTITYGPDLNGRSVRQTSTWANGNVWMGDSAWVLVTL